MTIQTNERWCKVFDVLTYNHVKCNWRRDYIVKDNGRLSFIINRGTSHQETITEHEVYKRYGKWTPKIARALEKKSS